SGPWSINNSTFDYAGSSSLIAQSSLLTLSGITQSTLTLTDITYGNNGTATTKYNYSISGSSTGLQWTNKNYSGANVGDAHERSDPDNHIVWGAVDCSTLTANVV